MAIQFDLPSELIAQQPARPRDHARLLVYNRKTAQIIDAHFYDLPKFLPKGTTVVLNNSKVEKCRLRFGNIEIFVLEVANPTTVRAMVRPGKKFKLHAVIELARDIEATVIAIDDEGLRTLTLSCSFDSPLLEPYKEIPFPPYIAPNQALGAEYQTVYAKGLGSKAAPTAGLHFTDTLLATIANNHPICEITLHVGLGTFAPLRPEHLATGKLHSESFEISLQAAKKLQEAKSITAVGTTTVRCLESYRAKHRSFSEAQDATNILIRPSFEFQAVDHMITNFHLPGTSLLLMIEAFIASESELMRIYEHAIKEKYRFYSFGDAMLIIC